MTRCDGIVGELHAHTQCLFCGGAAAPSKLQELGASPVAVAVAVAVRTAAVSSELRVQTAGLWRLVTSALRELDCSTAPPPNQPTTTRSRPELFAARHHT